MELYYLLVKGDENYYSHPEGYNCLNMVKTDESHILKDIDAKMIMKEYLFNNYKDIVDWDNCKVLPIKDRMCIPDTDNEEIRKETSTDVFRVVTLPIKPEFQKNYTWRYTDTPQEYLIDHRPHNILVCKISKTN